MGSVKRFFQFIGNLSLFGYDSLKCALRPPFEFRYFVRQVEETGLKSLPLVLAAGFALGVITTFYTRGTLVRFGARA